MADNKKKKDSVVTICYGRRQVWKSRREAMNHFLEGMMCSEGSEQQRYATIYAKLVAGETECSDGDD